MDAINSGQTSRQRNECPICGKYFAVTLLNKHVNDCLNKTSDDSEATPARLRKRKAEESAAEWAALMPAMLSAGAASKAKRAKTSNTSRRSKGASPSKRKDAKGKTVSLIEIGDDDEDENEDDFTPRAPSGELSSPRSKSKTEVASDDDKSPELIEESSSDDSSYNGAGKGSRNRQSSGSSTDIEPQTSSLSTTIQMSMSPKTDERVVLSAHKQRSLGKISQTSSSAVLSSLPVIQTAVDKAKSDKAKSDKAKSLESTPLTSRPSPQKVATAAPKKIPLSSLGLSMEKGAKGAEFAPLAEQMRPLTLESFVGQEAVVGDGTLLRTLLQNDNVPSMILWGPPGCGKTTLARIVAQQCKSKGSAKFVHMSATNSGVSDVKELIKVAKGEQSMFHRKTILFLDEIHRFNKTQQDSLLPHVESGTIILIGATTENPSFQVNSALLSRCRVIVLEKLSADNIRTILGRAVECLGLGVCEDKREMEQLRREPGAPEVWVQREGLGLLAQLVDGDARAALNCLQMAAQSRLTGPGRQSTSTSANTCPLVDLELIKSSLQRAHVLYDKTGEEHYNIISALHKSIRGSHSSAALYWLARMLEGGEDPGYIARRLVRASSEDIGLADPAALTLAISTQTACQTIGMPECEVMLAQCAVYLARAPKSVEVYKAYQRAKMAVKQHKGPLPSVPLHLRNAPTKLMKNLGYGKNYKYNPDYAQPVDQQYLPDGMEHEDFFL